VPHTAATPPEFTSRVDLGFTDLLVAYDFSATAGRALEYAVELSHYFGSTIHLINVETPAEHCRVMNTEPRVREHARYDVQRAFNNIEKHLRAKGIPCDSSHRVGEVSDILEGAMLEAKTDLLLLGAFGHGRPRLGSTAAHILRVASCPVLAIGPNALHNPTSSPKIDRLVCVTTSPDDDHDLLRFSSTLAMAVHGRLELLHVVDPKHSAAPAEEKARLCGTCSCDLRNDGVRANWTSVYGPPDEVIPARSAELKASLVVMSIRRSIGEEPAPVNHALINTIRKAHCPVLAVPSGLSLQQPNYTVISPRSM
jgi:nucleotide-binding universal stress UspA family protein